MPWRCLRPNTATSRQTRGTSPRVLCARSTTWAKPTRAISCSMPTTFASCRLVSSIRIPKPRPRTTTTMRCWCWLEDAGIRPADWTVHEAERLRRWPIPHRLDPYVDRSAVHVPFEIDGVVYKVTSRQHREQLGMTAHHPRWALPGSSHRRKPSRCCWPWIGRPGAPER